MKDIKYEIENNEFVKLLLESIGEGIFVLNTQGTIIAWNPAMEVITGYSFKEINGKSCQILNFNQCFNKRCPTGMNDCGILKYGKVKPVECLLSHKNGLNRLGGIIAKSQVMQNVFTFIKASAASDTTILIQGESGTGKELVADAIHSIGERRDKPLVTINCSALSESLLESELFGHVKGAFTGANQDRIGRFEQADGGTIFLDEIGEITPYLQVKLLRVLQQKEIERVGESKKRKIDIRIITASNKNLKDLVSSEYFREDLYYRLKVFPIYLPALRDRKEDIPLLINHFIKVNNKKSAGKVKGIDKIALKFLMDYTWPGKPVNHNLPLNKEKLTELLYICDWNKAEVARRVGLSRASIWKYMKKWDIPTQRTTPKNNQ